MRDAVAALFGVVLVVAGVAMVFVPAGLITAGVAVIAVAYVARYLEVKRNEGA